MRRLKWFLVSLLFSVTEVSAQITSGGSASISGLFTDLLGINFSDPYVMIGFTATFGLMWVSVYIIFKTGIKKIDSGYGGRRSNPVGDALGLNGDSRNLLAVLTLLITLSTVGTGAFTGLIQGWQSLILLAFSFMLLAGLIFVLLGGTGGIIGGTAYVTGKSAKFASEGVKELKDELDGLRSEEESLDDLEDEIEDEEKDAKRREDQKRNKGSESGDDSGSSRRDRRKGSERDTGEGTEDSSRDSGRSGSETGSDRTEAEVKDIVNKLEKVFEILEDIEGKLSQDMSRESERIDEKIRQLEELRKILESDETPYRELRELIEDLNREGIDGSGSEDELESAMGERDISEILTRSELRNYISELEELKEDLRELEAEIALLREIEGLLENLQEEVGGAEKEEEILENLIRNLGDSEIKEKLAQRLKRDKEELDDIENRFKDLKKFSDKISEFFEFLEALQDELESLQELIEEVEIIHGIARLLENFYTSHTEIEFLSFSPGDSNYISKGTRFSVPGSGETVLIDTSLEMTPSSDESSEAMFEQPYESLLRDLAEPLSAEFKRRGRRGNSDRAVQGLLLTLFRILEEKQNISKNDGEISLKDYISSSKRYSSGLLNSVYLGMMLENISAVYSMMMKYDDRDEEARAITKSAINEYAGKSRAYLSSYQNEEGPEPVVVLEDESGRYGFLLRSGDFIEDIDEDRTKGVYLIE